MMIITDRVFLQRITTTTGLYGDDVLASVLARRASVVVDVEERRGHDAVGRFLSVRHFSLHNSN